MPGPEIIKVQAAIFPPDGPLLVYNEDRTLTYHGPASQEVLDLLDGRAKAYFYASVDPDTRELVIRGEAPCQDW